ncbi:MAG: class I SAM-dependent methyltransferase [Xenococcaceae cyanobacterium MO_188.B29]|nr:class I SAM-dependent methyltransferase [Xenococcaceae cyanobacterium MO_188.B29]
MKHNGSHNFISRLYQTKVFTSIYDRIAGEFSSAFLWDELTKKFLDYIPTGGTILEIGAGSGLLAIKILQYRPDLSVIASDFSSQMLSLAKKNYQERICKDEQLIKVQSQLRFVQADVMDLSQFTGENIDGIYSLGAIKHFPEPLHGLRQCIGILKTGGQMFFTDFAAEGSLSGTRKVAKHLRIPVLIKFVVIPLFHFAIKRKAVTNEDVQMWKNELEKSGDSVLEYSPGNSMFTLIFKKR